MMKAPIEQMMDSLDWTSVESQPQAQAAGLPYVTHAGVLVVGEMRLRCYRLNTGEAVIDADDMHKFFGGMLG